ncbi:hypothetical protein L7F22_031306 [Adiantum nelumboides]|nr:hypothetical protein [Adiantum nelumboides]
MNPGWNTCSMLRQKTARQWDKAPYEVDKLSTNEKSHIPDEVLAQIPAHIFIAKFRDEEGDNIKTTIMSREIWTLHRRPEVASAVRAVHLEQFFRLPPWGIDYMRAHELMSSIQYDGKAMLTDSDGAKVEVLITKDIINEALQFIHGAYDLIPKTKAIDNEKAFLKVKGSKFKYSNLIYSKLELPLRLISHLRVQKPPRYTEPFLHMAVVMALCVAERRQVRCDFARYILESLIEANLKNSAKNKLYMNAGPMLTRVAYQALDMIEDLPVASSQAALIQQAKYVPKAVRTTSSADFSRSTRSKKSSSEEERIETDKEQDSQESTQEDVPREAEASVPSEYKSDEEDTSIPLERKKQRAAQLAREKIKEALSRKVEDPVLEPTQGSLKRPRQEEEEDIEHIQADPIPPSPINIPPAPPSSPITSFPPASTPQTPPSPSPLDIPKSPTVPTSPTQQPFFAEHLKISTSPQEEIAQPMDKNDEEEKQKDEEPYKPADIIQLDESTNEEAIQEMKSFDYTKLIQTLSRQFQCQQVVAKETEIQKDRANQAQEEITNLRTALELVTKERDANAKENENLLRDLIDLQIQLTRKEAQNHELIKNKKKMKEQLKYEDARFQKLTASYNTVKNTLTALLQNQEPAAATPSTSDSATTAQHKAKVKQLELELAKAKADLKAVGSLASTSQIQAETHLPIQPPQMPEMPEFHSTEEEEQPRPAPGALDIREQMEQEIEDMPKGHAKEYLMYKNKVMELAALAFLQLEEQIKDFGSDFLPLPLMRHEANLWKEKMRPAVQRNEDGGMRARKEAAEWEAQARGKEELVKESVEVQRQILLLQNKLERAKSALWKRAGALIFLKKSAIVFSSWPRHLDYCRKRKVLKRAEHVWNHKVLANWFSLFQDALLTLKKRWQTLKVCVLRLKRRTLCQILIHWQSWTNRKKVLSKACVSVVRSSEWRLLKKCTTGWKIMCCKTLYQKTQKKKAAMVSRRCQLQKAWKSWFITFQASFYYRDVARQHYVRKKLDCLFIRWKLYSAQQACRHMKAISAAEQRATFLMKVSFAEWIDVTRHCLLLQKLLAAVQYCGNFKLKKNMFQFLLHLAFRNIEKIRFRLSLRSKRETLVKERVFACFARQTLHRRLINKFLSLQSSRRRLHAFNEWRLQVNYQHWVWAKRKQKDVYIKKHTFFAWLLYHEMGR